MQLDVYGEVVGALERPGRRLRRRRKQFVLPEFLAFVMNVYDRLAALDAAAGAETILSQDGSPPGPTSPARPLDLDVLDEPQRAPLWLRYFFQARQVIDGFYPELPPLPPRLQTSPAQRRTATILPAAGRAPAAGRLSQRRAAGVRWCRRTARPGTPRGHAHG